MFALWRAVLEARRAFDAANQAETALAQQVYPHYPERPENLYSRRHCGDGEVRLIPLMRFDLEDLIESERKNGHFQSQQIIAGYEKRLRALEAYEAERDAIDEKFGLPPLRAAAEAAEAALDLAEDRLAQGTPSTERGVTLKLRFGIKRFYYSANELEAPAPQTVLSAIRDMVRLRRTAQGADHA